MKILLSNVGFLDNPNAAFLRTYYFARELVKLGNDVTLLTNQKSGFRFPFIRHNRVGIEIISFPNLFPYKISKFGYDILNIILRLLYVISRDFDIVHSDNHRPVSAIPCLLHAKMRKSKYITEWWDYFGKTGQYDNKSKFFKIFIGKADNYYEEFFPREADGVVVLSKLLKSRALRLGQHEDAIELIWGGSDVEEIHYYPSSIINRSRFSIGKNSFVFMATGMGNKEILEYRSFFKALYELNKIRQDFIFIRTGTPVSEQIKNVLNLGAYYVEAGFVAYSDYQYLLSCADVFVLVQENNNKNNGRWPNCVGDYLAVGRPIIHNEIGELKDFYSKFPLASIVVNVNDKKILIEQLNHLIDSERDALKKRSKIRDYAEKYFSWESRAKQLVEFYQRRI